MQTDPTSFKRFCEIMRHASRLRRPHERDLLIGDYFDSLPPESKVAAIRLATEGAQVGIGYQSLAKLASNFCHIDYEMVFRPCHKVMGGVPETIEKLLENIDEARVKHRHLQYNLGEIMHLYLQLGQLAKKSDREAFFDRIFCQLTPIEVFFFLKCARGGVFQGLSGFGADIVAQRPGIAAKDLDRISEDELWLDSHGYQTSNGFNRLLGVLMYIQSDFGFGTGLPTNMTIGVRVDDVDEFQEDVIPIGRISQVIKDEMLEELAGLVKPRIRERFGPTLMLEPSLVVEVEYRSVVENRRTKAGYQLEEARLIGVHASILPNQCKSLKELM